MGIKELQILEHNPCAAQRGGLAPGLKCGLSKGHSRINILTAGQGNPTGYRAGRGVVDVCKATILRGDDLAANIMANIFFRFKGLWCILHNVYFVNLGVCRQKEGFQSRGDHERGSPLFLF